MQAYSQHVPRIPRLGHNLNAGIIGLSSNETLFRNAVLIIAVSYGYQIGSLAWFHFLTLPGRLQISLEVKHMVKKIYGYHEFAMIF